MKIKIQIKSVLGKVLFELEKENNTIKETIEEAVKSYANLSYANLRSADLSSANLSYADLSYANLSYANLSYANLRSANLRSADLSSANLSYANLRSADLSSANLSYADLDIEKMKECGVLKYLNVFRNDLWAILLGSNEVDYLLDALKTGKVDGSTYEGDCACLVGTIANSKKVHYKRIPNLIPDSSRPAEVWFAKIHKGDTPESSQYSKLTVEWVEEFKNMIAAKQLIAV